MEAVSNKSIWTLVLERILRKVGDTWKDFVLKLSGVFGVDERLCWDI